MKRTCKKCGVEKDIKEFRESIECNYGFSWTCKECHRIYKNKYNRTEKNKKQRRIYMRAIRKTEKHKALMRKHNCLQKAKDRAKKYNRSKIGIATRAKRKKAIVAMLSDLYIKSLLTQKTNLKFKDIPQSFVNLKREQIKINRFLKEQAS